jgi:alkanesulfonate monooxygenase SsuD/methylene tetrahydromethanopterin reductase-like flavin-dependent oxidoreductase (luciferase family)
VHTDLLAGTEPLLNTSRRCALASAAAGECAGGQDTLRRIERGLAVPARVRFNVMDVSVCLDTSHQYRDLLALARRAETAGLHAVYVPDHCGEFREAWTVLTAIAASTERIRVGTLVLSVTHRPTGVLAGMAHTVQEVSAGRLLLGIGAGWNEAEHATLGLPFPSAPRRLDLLEEASAVLRDAVEAPLLVGGGGERRTMRIAAAHADVWHAWATPEEFARKCSVLDEHCGSVGRSPSSVRRATGAEVTGGLDSARLLASYEADEFIARYPREFTTAQALAAIEHLGGLVGPAGTRSPAD